MSKKDKINKLLSLANNNPNENEALSALEKAQEMILRSSLEDEFDENIFYKTIVEEKLENKVSEWQAKLSAILADNFACISIFNPLTIYGKRGDIENVKILYYELCSRLENLVKYHTKMKSNPGREWVNSFREGLLNGIEEKIIQIVANLNEEQRSVLHAKKRIVENWFSTKAVEINTNQKELDQTAFSLGLKTGKNLYLHNNRN